jgi:hypothetical protein
MKQSENEKDSCKLNHEYREIRNAFIIKIKIITQLSHVTMQLSRKQHSDPLKK